MKEISIIVIIIAVLNIAAIIFFVLKGYQLNKKRENLQPGDIVRFNLDESIEVGKIDRIVNKYWVSIETIDGNVYTVNKKHVY